jgi:3',5'-nucleoside bisphosphate phosphatase
LTRQKFDLHIHSDLSDGRFPAEDVLERCAAAGLHVVALTDHDLANAVHPGEWRFGSRSIRVISAAEISGTHEGREFHLCVYFPGDVPTGFRDFCAIRAKERAVRYSSAVQSIGLPGLECEDDEALRGKRALTRLHLAQALVQAGHVNTIRDAFATYTGDRHGHVPQVGLNFVDAIKVARGFGGLTSWAHPPVKFVRSHLPTFVDAGLHGIEGYRPRLKARTRAVYKKAARTYGLFLTGGSDWHGWKDPDLGLFHTSDIELKGFIDALQWAA